MTVYDTVVYKRLIQAAKTEDEFVSYKEIIALAGLKLTGDALSGALGRLFYEIVMYDRSQDPKRPMLSAVAVNAEGYPSNGFYELARDLGLLHSKDEKTELEFWLKELSALRRYWQQM